MILLVGPALGPPGVGVLFLASETRATIYGSTFAWTRRSIVSLSKCRWDWWEPTDVLNRQTSQNQGI